MFKNSSDSSFCPISRLDHEWIVDFGSCLVYTDRWQKANGSSFMFSCQLISTLQEHVRYQTRPSTCEGTHQGGTNEVDESLQSEPSQALPTTEHDHVIHREESPPSEVNEKMEESSCNVEDAHVNITMPSQNNNSDEDVPSAKDLLCLAWQIAQGMVSRNWNSPEKCQTKFFYQRGMYLLISLLIQETSVILSLITRHNHYSQGCMWLE